jgi:aspartate racemase
MKRLGVLGGMGPAATAHFFQRVIELTPAASDQEHIPMVVYNDPTVPDRTEAILGRGPSPVPVLTKGLKLLEQAGCEVIAIPCNSAHFFYAELQQATDVPLLNILTEVVDAVSALRPPVEKAGLLATTGTARSGIYREPLAQIGCELVLPEEWEQGDLMAVIRRIKGAEGEAEQVRVFAEALISRGVQAIILGCTELSLVAGGLDLSVPVVDSVEVLAQAAVEAALERRNLNRQGRWVVNDVE